MRTLLLGLFAASAALLVLTSASAKDFQPGDLRACNRTRCVAVVNRDVLPKVGSFYYSGPCPARVRGPKLGAPYYELRFRNGYVTGIVATRRLDRFLTYGVHDQRFARNIWYAVPRKLSGELRRGGEHTARVTSVDAFSGRARGFSALRGGSRVSRADVVLTFCNA